MRRHSEKMTVLAVVVIYMFFCLVGTDILQAEDLGVSCADGQTLTVDEARNAWLHGHTLILDTPDYHNGNAGVQNNTGCAVPITLVSYKIDAPPDLRFQTFFNQDSAIVTASSSRAFHVDLPACNFQVDFYYGSNPPKPIFDANNPAVDEFFLNQGIINRENIDGGLMCPVVTPTPTPTPTPAPDTFTVVCPDIAGTFNINQDVTRRVEIASGTVPYVIQWSGTDNLTGSESSITKTYSSIGTKEATVSVTDAENRRIERVCNTIVVDSTSSSRRRSSSRTITKKPTVTLIQTVEPAPLAEASVTLTHIPYTGVDSYPKEFVFISIVTLCSIAISASLYIRTRQRSKRREAGIDAM